MNICDFELKKHGIVGKAIGFRDRDLRAPKQGHNCVNLPQIYTEIRDQKSLKGPYRYLVPRIGTPLWHFSGEKTLKVWCFHIEIPQIGHFVAKISTYALQE